MVPGSKPSLLDFLSMFPLLGREAMLGEGNQSLHEPPFLEGVGSAGPATLMMG